MDCSRASDLMMIYFDRMLNASEKNELYLHNKGCGLCRSEFEILDEALSGVDELENFIAPKDFEVMIMKSIDVKSYMHKKTYMPIIITGTVMLFALLTAFIFLRYGTVDFRENHSYVTAVTDWISLSAFANQLGRIVSNLGAVWVNGLSNLPSYHKEMIGVYFALLLLLCTFFIGLQLILIKMITGRISNGGALYEK